MALRLSELAGCTATAEEFFPTAMAGNRSILSVELGAILAEKDRRDCDSTLGLQLACLLQQVESATNHAQRLVLGRSEQELTTRVRRGSWSVMECLEHLALATRTFLPPIAEIMTKTPRLIRNRPLRCDVLARVLIHTLEPPYRLRHKVLPHLAPQHNAFPSTWKTFLETQEELGQIIRSAVGLAIDTVKIQSPVCSQLSYSVYGALGILSAHQRRHLWQMERVLHALDRSAA